MEDIQRGLAAGVLKIIRIVAGYVFAVVTASTTTVAVIFVLGIFGDGEAPVSQIFFIMLMLSAIYTGITAWPGYLVTVVLALVSNVHVPPVVFAGAGVLTALQAMWLHSLTSPSFDVFPGLALPILIGGAVGGFCYGLVHYTMHSQK